MTNHSMSGFLHGTFLVTVAVGCLFACRMVNAQPVTTSVPSLEWAAAQSSVVARGTIEEILEHPYPDGLALGQGIHRYQTISFRVAETIKGEPSDLLQFVENGDWGSVRLSELQKSRQEVLLFLEPWSTSPQFNRASGGYAYTRFPNVVHFAAILEPGEIRWASSQIPAMSSDMSRPTSSEHAIQFIRKFLSGEGKQAKLHGTSKRLPPALKGGFYEVNLTIPAVCSSNVQTNRQPSSFSEFSKRFAKTAPGPGSLKPPYTRHRSGYVGVPAVELMALDSDVVVRGRVIESSFVSRTDDPTGDAYAARIEVFESIKGNASKEIACFVTDARDLADLANRQQELILFLDMTRGRGLPEPAGALEFTLRETLWDDSVIVLDQTSEALFADLTWHKSNREILDQLRAVTGEWRRDGAVTSAIHPPSQVPVLALHLPDSLAASSSIEGNRHAIVYLPVTRELETYAQRWSVSDNPDRRWIATRALIYFKSTENASLLMRMLDDRTVWERRAMLAMTHLAYPHEPDYLIRWEAWHVLTGWGFDLAMPEFKMP